METEAKKEVRVDRNAINVIQQERGISNVELARRMGVHHNAIIRIKKEQSTSFNGLTSLCEALNCHPFDIIRAEGFPPPLVDAPASLVAVA